MSEIKPPNYFQCPNVIIDEYLSLLSGAELKCFLFVVRKTKGWHKEADSISVSQFCASTGLSNRAVIDACNSLVSRGFLFQSSGARSVKVFSLDCKNITSEESSLVKKVHVTSEESSQVTSEESSHTKDTFKETIQKKNNITLEAQKNEDEVIKNLTRDDTRKRFAMTLDWTPNPQFFTAYCKGHLVTSEQLTSEVLEKFRMTANAEAKNKTEAQWCLNLAQYLQAVIKNPIKKQREAQEPRMNIPAYVPEMVKPRVIPSQRTTSLSSLFE